MDWIVTGASRGIGRALVQRLAAAAEPGGRVFALARDATRLATLVQEARGQGSVVAVSVDLARAASARDVGERLAQRVGPEAVLVHNAGVWPSRCTLVDGLEGAFVTHCLGPLLLQAPLLEAGRLARVLVVSAGLLVKGRFHADKTASGGDFSAFRTYCTTKLAGAAAMRDAARRYPGVDFAVVHPGVVNTDLGARGGPLGWLLKLAKRSWETPEVCAARLLRLLAQPRWELSSGEAPWYVEESRQPWPAAVERDAAAVRATLERLLAAPRQHARSS